MWILLIYCFVIFFLYFALLSCIALLNNFFLQFFLMQHEKRFFFQFICSRSKWFAIVRGRYFITNNSLINLSTIFFLSFRRRCCCCIAIDCPGEIKYNKKLCFFAPVSENVPFGSALMFMELTTAEGISFIKNNC